MKALQHLHAERVVSKRWQVFLVRIIHVTSRRHSSSHHDAVLSRRQRVFPARVERQALFAHTPVAGIVVLGSTGEAIAALRPGRRDVLEIITRAATAPNKVLVAGTAMESAIRTLRLTEYAAELGYDVAMVRTPHLQEANAVRESSGVLPHRGRPLASAGDHLQLSPGYGLRHSCRTGHHLAEHPN